MDVNIKQLLGLFQHSKEDTGWSAEFSAYVQCTVCVCLWLSCILEYRYSGERKGLSQESAGRTLVIWPDEMKLCLVSF